MRSGDRKRDDSSPAKHVLVAEDDDAIRRLLAITLRRAGLMVDAVRDGAEAIQHLGQRRYLALISDLMMPNMSGWDVIRWLQKHPAERPRSIIITTAADRSVMRGLDPNVVNAIFVKPFNVMELAAYVTACCRHRNGRDRRRSRVIRDRSVLI